MHVRASNPGDLRITWDIASAQVAMVLVGILLRGGGSGGADQPPGQALGYAALFGSALGYSCLGVMPLELVRSWRHTGCAAAAID